MDLIQMDVKTTFLHADLHEEIYMQQPKGEKKHVCKLKKAPRKWYHKFDAFMKS
eukprot:c12967_g1_i1 orf=52-213(-)